MDITLNRKGHLFEAASQAATATTVGLAATYTGLCLSNPAASGIWVIPRQIGIALSVAPAAIAVIGIGGGYAAGGITAHTTALNTYSCNLGDASTSVGKADAATTLVGTPRVIMPMINGFTAAALFPAGPAITDLQGTIQIPPGGYIFVYTLTAVTGFFGITWEEFRLTV